MMTEPIASGLCRDRLNGLRAAVPELNGTLIGRWIFDLGGEEAFINSAAASHNDFLVPEPSGNWYILTGSGERISGTVARAQIPDELEAESVRTIGKKLDELVEDGESWLEWLGVVPLVPGISEQADLQRLELLVRENYGHLEIVCRKPRAHLHVEVERVPVSKARRFPPTAGAYLASHTEDWDRPLLRGILPKRILAEVRHDKLDIYENRVTARLLDNVAAYVGRRIRVIKRLLKVFQEKEDYSSAMRGTYQRARRISELWGQSIDAKEGRRKAEASLRELEWLKYKLMGLLDSTLYQEVPRRAYVPTTLKTTNIFANDQHYQRVAEIWREWASTGVGRIQSPRELNEEAQHLCRGMDAFSMLLVVRAMNTLGYEPIDEQIDKPIARGTELRLSGQGVELMLRWSDDGSISIFFDDREMVIVALATDLGAGTDDQVASVLERLKEIAFQRSSTEYLVIYLSSSEGLSTLDLRLGRSLHTIGNDPRNILAGGGCLPVSPWEIGSTERLSRALRWFLTRTRFQDYPQRIDIPVAARESIKVEQHQRWLSPQNGGSLLEICCPPMDYEFESLGVENLLESARSDATRARENHQNISETLRRMVREGPTGSLSKQKRDAHEEMLRCEELVKGMEFIETEFRRARDRSTALLVCPACGTKADSIGDFERRDHSCFWCTCRSCRTYWGIQMCRNGHRYAAMLPSGDFCESDDEQHGWEDRIYGGDILAVPARKPGGDWGFVCPECGEIS